MSEPESQPPSVDSRILSLNFRLSDVEAKHLDLTSRVDDIDDELKEIWDAIGKSS